MIYYILGYIVIFLVFYGFLNEAYPEGNNGDVNNFFPSLLWPLVVFLEIIYRIVLILKPILCLPYNLGKFIGKKVNGK